jgi:GAF domain-containing protein
MIDVKIDATLSKKEKYILLEEQIKLLKEENCNEIAKLCNCISAIHFTFNFHWTGIYLVNENKLELSIFQGPVACTTIGFGKGVCGTTWKNKETIIVDDVDTFEGHIACSSLSKSEIVVPLFNNSNDVIAVLDIDSEQYSLFDETDKFHLENITKSLLTLTTTLIKITSK